MRAVVIILALVYACPVDAANLYVNNSGSPSCSDATAKASNSAAAPWCTIERARKGATFGSGANSGEAAAAGDVVHITCGTYEATPTDANFQVALNPVNEGTSGNPIRFQAVNNQAACIRVTPNGGSITAGNGSIIGAIDRDYIEWAGFNFNETDWPWGSGCADLCSGYQNGFVLFYSTDPVVPIPGGKIELSTLTGTVTTSREGNNYTAIRIQKASVTIKNNTCTDFGVADHNNACMISYFGVGIVVEQNRLLNSGAGLYFKNNSLLVAGTSQHIVRKNYIAVNNTGVFCYQNCNGTALAPILIYQNVIVGGEKCFQVLGLDTDVQNPLHVHIVNNTCYNQTSGSEPYFFRVGGSINTGAGWKIYNNIASVASGSVLADGGAGSGDLDTAKLLFEHQVYHSIAGTFASWSGIGSISLATWKATYGQDNTSPAAITTDPVFVSAGTDFRLCTGAGTPSGSCAGASNALTQGRVIDSIGGVDGATIPAGAYITGNECIGLEASCSASSGSIIRIRRSGL